MARFLRQSWSGSAGVVGRVPAWSGNAVEARSACLVAVGQGGQRSRGEGRLFCPGGSRKAVLARRGALRSGAFLPGAARQS